MKTVKHVAGKQAKSRLLLHKVGITYKRKTIRSDRRHAAIYTFRAASGRIIARCETLVWKKEPMLYGRDFLEVAWALIVLYITQCSTQQLLEIQPVLQRLDKVNNLDFLYLALDAMFAQAYPEYHKEDNE